MLFLRPHFSTELSRFTQQKTKRTEPVALELQVHPELLKAINAMKQASPITTNGWRRQACRSPAGRFNTRYQSLGKKNGAQGRDRTTDTTIFNRMLYQLSYLGTLSPGNRVTDLQLIAKDRAGYNTRCSAVQLPLQGKLDKFASP